MTYVADPRVDAYIDALPAWQQAVCRAVRDLVHAADPEVTETIKRTNRPYVVLQGIITGGHGNTTARTVAVRQGDTINASALTAMLKHIIAHNRAGGWRTLKRDG